MIDILTRKENTMDNRKYVWIFIYMYIWAGVQWRPRLARSNYSYLAAVILAVSTRVISSKSGVCWSSHSRAAICKVYVFQTKRSNGLYRRQGK